MKWGTHPPYKIKTKQKITQYGANRLVVNAASLKPSSFGFAGSNPASRIFFLVLVVQWLEQSAVNR